MKCLFKADSYRGSNSGGITLGESKLGLFERVRWLTDTNGEASNFKLKVLVDKEKLGVGLVVKESLEAVELSSFHEVNGGSGRTDGAWASDLGDLRGLLRLDGEELVDRLWVELHGSDGLVEI